MSVNMLPASVYVLVLSSIVLGTSSYIQSVPCSYSLKCLLNYAGGNARYSDDFIYITDQYGQTRTASNLQVTNPCSSACGQNTQCSVVADRPVCSCLKGYAGDPLNYCKPVECLDNTECNNHQVCKNEKCVDPCDGICGLYAKCEARNHIAVCSCPAGFTGNPLDACRRFDLQELCYPNPCGPNTLCQAANEILTCKCLPSYIRGSFGCKHECESDSECAPQLACVDFKCQNPCLSCGLNAECHKVINHSPVCLCPESYVGNPLVSCQPECTADNHCPLNKPTCYGNSCVNLCDKQVCGYAEKCEIRSGLLVECVKGDLCQPNPCGDNTECRTGHDRFNEPRPVCTCLPGYIGNPLTVCVKAECTEDGQCTNDKACIDYKCENPCNAIQCGVNAQCTPLRHCGVCTCQSGYQGNPLINCVPDICSSTTCT